MSSFVASAARELVEALDPLEAAFTDEASFRRLLERHGWSSTVPKNSVEYFQTLLDLTSLLGDAQLIIGQLEMNSGDIVELAGKLKTAAVALFERIGSVKLPSTPPPELSLFPFDDNTFWSEFPAAVLDDLLISHLERRSPALFGMLLLFGIIEINQATPPAAGRIPYVKRSIQWSKLGTALGDPGAQLRSTYHWNEAATPFDHERLTTAVELLLLAVRLPVRRSSPRPALTSRYFAVGNSSLPVVEEVAVPVYSGVPYSGTAFLEIGLLLLAIPPASDKSRPPDGLAIASMTKGVATTTFNLRPGVDLELRGGFDADGAVAFEAHPNSMAVTVNTPTLDAEAKLVAKPSTPWRVLGTADSHRLEVGGALASMALKGSLADPEFIVKLGTGEEPNPPQLALIVQFADGDSFLQKLFGSQPQRFEFSGLITWSSKTGLAFQGEAGITLIIPLNKSLGPVDLHSLMVALTAAGKGGELIVAATGNAVLGPIAISAERVGVKMALKPTEPGQPAGLFGNLDVAFGFKSPDGLGLSVDAGPIAGGGFLAIDAANGRYAGVLQLEAAGIAITAVGLLDTKLPGGAPGFSFLIIITAKFPPIQLGFGFALTGLGGLAAIHRSIVVQALQDGVRNKAVDHILFPEIPIRDATKLISDLQVIFPPTEGQYVFGPMASIVWGTPPIVEAELGIILELPDPIRLVILGQLTLALPSVELLGTDVPTPVELHLDIGGILDFTDKWLSIDASLYDSRLAAFSLSGDMAMRLSWGDPPNFAFSVGGLHPQFQPPPAFPTLRRLTLAVCAGENPRLTLEAYLAVTSNTGQFGARAELYAEAAGFNVYGWIGFDVLLVFVPLSLTAGLSAGVAIRHGSLVLGAVDLVATLTGPTPWHVWGEASISVLVAKVTVPFDETFGEDQVIEVQPGDPWAALKAEIEKAGNWSATLPPAAFQVVALLAPPEDEAGLSFIDPLGGLTFQQKAVPLERTLSKFGQAPLPQAQRFSIAGVSVGTQPASAGDPLLGYFAPEPFEYAMSDAEKLSRASFELMRAGTTLSSQAVDFGYGQGAEYTYETKIIDAPDQPARPPADNHPYTLGASQQTAALQRSAAGQSFLRKSGLDKYVPGPSDEALLVLHEEAYAIVDTENLLEEESITVPDPRTKGAVCEALKAHLAAHPEDRGRLAVVPAHEAEVAA